MGAHVEWVEDPGAELLTSEQLAENTEVLDYQPGKLWVLISDQGGNGMAFPAHALGPLLATLTSVDESLRARQVPVYVEWAEEVTRSAVVTMTADALFDAQAGRHAALYARLSTLDQHELLADETESIGITVVREASPYEVRDAQAVTVYEEGS